MKSVAVTTKRGQTFLVPASDTRTVQLLEGADVWGKTALTTLRRILPKPRTVVDVGANVGMSAMSFVGWAKQVVSFEPHPDLFKLLCRNCAGTTVAAYNYGLGAKEGEVSFAYAPSSPLGAHVTQRDTGLTVAVRPLDSFRFTEVDYIKLDVEGQELNVLKGAVKTIKKSLPVVLAELEPAFLKRAGHTPQDVMDFMAGLGYSAYTVKLKLVGPTWGKIPRERDRLFLHPTGPQKAFLSKKGFK